MPHLHELNIELSEQFNSIYLHQILTEKHNLRGKQLLYCSEKNINTTGEKKQKLLIIGKIRKVWTKASKTWQMKNRMDLLQVFQTDKRLGFCNVFDHSYG